MIQSDGYSTLKREQWYAPYVNWAAAVGFVAGYKDGTFLPKRSVTRAEAATMIIRYAELTEGITAEKINEPAEFKDAIPNWAARSSPMRSRRDMSADIRMERSVPTGR